MAFNHEAHFLRKLFKVILIFFFKLFFQLKELQLLIGKEKRSGEGVFRNSEDKEEVRGREVCSHS